LGSIPYIVAAVQLFALALMRCHVSSQVLLDLALSIPAGWTRGIFAFAF
jgi:hypothetical protein